MAQAKSKRSTSGKSTTNQTTKKRSNTKSKQEMNGSMLEDYFVDALKDIFWAEKALTKALPKMSKAATSKELKKAFDQHLTVTKKQIGRL